MTFFYDINKKLNMLFESAKVEECCCEPEEQLDELGKKTLGSYIKKAAKDVDDTGYIQAHDIHRLKAQPSHSQSVRDKHQSRLDKRHKGIERATDRLTHEGFEEESGISASDLADLLCDRILVRKPELLQKYGPSEVSQACDWVADFHAGAEELGSSDISIMLREVERNLREYNDYKQEQLDELSKHTLGSYVKKAAQERGYHGAEAGRAGANRDRGLERSHTLKGEKRQRGIDTAMNKIIGSPIDEVSDELVKRAGQARYDQVRSAPRSNRDEMMSTFDKFSKNQRLQHQRDLRHKKAGLKGSDPISDYYQGSGSQGRYFGDSVERKEKPINETNKRSKK